MTSITLQLSDKTVNYAKLAAKTLNKPVEEVLAEFLGAMVPPISDIPESMQQELIQMTWLPNEQLWQIARGEMELKAQERLTALSNRQETRQLTVDEEKELDTLRTRYGQVTLRKARAFALLSIRGGKPLLQ